MRKSIYECPHCGAKSFNPITKSFAGSQRNKGRACKECGRRSVNGKVSTIFNSIVYVLAFVLVLYIYFVDNTNWGYLMIPIVVVIAFLICRIFDAFFMPLEKPIRNDSVDL